MNDTELKALYEDMRVETEYFDTIDLFPLMEENMLIADLMDKIEDSKGTVESAADENGNRAESADCRVLPRPPMHQPVLWRYVDLCTQGRFAEGRASRRRVAIHKGLFPHDQHKAGISACRRVRHDTYGSEHVTHKVREGCR